MIDNVCAKPNTPLFLTISELSNITQSYINNILNSNTMETFDQWLYKVAEYISINYRIDISKAYSSIDLTEAKFEYLSGVDALLYAKSF